MDKQLFKRSAGILLPVASLPSPYGIGSFGKAARDWVDFLSEAGQSFWQILPLVPAGYGNSPYKSQSAFAGYPSLIDLDVLREEGLIEEKDCKDVNWDHTKKRVDYEKVDSHREKALRKAYERFHDHTPLDDFVKNNFWAEDYGMYMAIKASQGGREWMDWDKPLRTRKPKALAEVKNRLSEEIRYYIFVQYIFAGQWKALRTYANSKGVEIIGDIPIYVALDSADVWSNQKLFRLDKNSLPPEVSGCPPDSFTEDGQLWGNPLYDWGYIAKTGFKWWNERLRHSFGLYDVVRIDHFRGFEGYYSIPYGAETAKEGKWKPGPGKAFIDAVKKALPGKRIIAEDLGVRTEGVVELVDYSGFPNMKLLQFAFDSRAGKDKDDLPLSYKRNTVVYPGTHDNDTLTGWCETAPYPAVKKAMAYTGVKRPADLPPEMIRLAYECDSILAVIPMQDWLGLGSEARLNTPGSIGGSNWRWRLEERAAGDRLAASIYEMTSLYGRIRAVKA